MIVIDDDLKRVLEAMRSIEGEDEGNGEESDGEESDGEGEEARNRREIITATTKSPTYFLHSNCILFLQINKCRCHPYPSH